jgi:uncharacterized protein (TIGR03086 family)
MDLIDVLDLARTRLDPVVAAIGGDQWTLPTPCEGWDVRELLNHVVAGSILSSILVAGGSREEATTALQADNLGADPIAAYTSALDAQAEAFGSVTDFERVVPHPTMDLTVGILLGFRVGDLVVHGWDLARATGQDEEIDPRLVQAVWANIEPILPILPSTGVFGEGPSGTVPDDAPLQRRMLDALGRRP